MRKPDFEKVLKQDIEESPSWFTSILEPLNRLFEYINEAFDSNISVANLKAQSLTLSFTAPFSQTSFQKTKSGKIFAVFLAQVLPQTGSTLSWEEINSQITVTSITGLTPGTDYNVKLLALYE